jgi:hypothetical protein
MPGHYNSIFRRSGHRGYNPGMRDDRKKPGVAFWATVVLLYVASFGPMRMVGVHYEKPRPTVPSGGFAISIDGHTVFDEVPSAWYQTLYEPLIWASWQSWGKPLFWYSSLFPIREA